MVNNMIFHDDELDKELKDKLHLLTTTPKRDAAKATRGRQIFLNSADKL